VGYVAFIEDVAGRAEVSLAEADALTRAALQTLAEQLTGVEAADLAGRVPAELRGCLGVRRDDSRRVGLDEFVRQVSLRAGSDREVGADGVRAVFQVLREAGPVPGDFPELAAPRHGKSGPGIN
jgi:uncharacterized protein (DUF2267 family)